MGIIMDDINQLQKLVNQGIKIKRLYMGDWEICHRWVLPFRYVNLYDKIDGQMVHTGIGLYFNSRTNINK